MDFKVIIEKALKEEDYSADISALPAEEQPKAQIAVNSALKKVGDETLAKVSGLRKEKQRIEEDLTKKQQDNSTATLEAIRSNAMNRGKNKFFSNPVFKVSDEQRTQIESELAKATATFVDEDQVFTELKKIYATLNVDTLVKNGEENMAFRQNAQDFNSMQANGGSTGAGSPDPSKYSKEAQELHKQWLKAGVKDKTLEDAERIVKRGDNWQSRNLSK